MLAERVDQGWRDMFWNVFKRSRNPIVLLDDSRRHVEVNPAYVRMIGHSRADLIGRPIGPFLAGGYRLSLAEWRRALLRGESVGEAEVLCGDGSAVSVQYAAHPEVVTGRQLVLFVVLQAAPAGRAYRRDTEASPSADGLSGRERQIVHLVALGQTGPEIAEELHISHETVRTHIRNAMDKLHARSRPQLVAIALGHGLIQPT